MCPAALGNPPTPRRCHRPFVSMSKNRRSQIESLLARQLTAAPRRASAGRGSPRPIPPPESARPQSPARRSHRAGADTNTGCRRFDGIAARRQIEHALARRRNGRRNRARLRPARARSHRAAGRRAARNARRACPARSAPPERGRSIVASGISEHRLDRRARDAARPQQPRTIIETGDDRRTRCRPARPAIEDEIDLVAEIVA